MNYREATEWLFNQIPNYQNQGGNAYKPGLERIVSFLESIGNPQDDLKIIHVAGTNGKGSVCHLIAAALQTNGLKAGIFSSPHIYSFTERIKVNGKLISEEEVTDFIVKNKERFLEFGLSFFEITAAMAFTHLSNQKVDYAIIETGLGGRLDATNVVKPILSVITKIGLDHMNFLGDTIPAIAMEKAGIIKSDQPVVLGDLSDEVREVVYRKSEETKSKVYEVEAEPKFPTSLRGEYQQENLRIAEKAIEALNIDLNELKTELGFLNAQSLTKFFGRFSVIGEKPRVIVDAAHNAQGIQELLSELSKTAYENIHVVFGTSSDKDLTDVFSTFSRVKAKYYLAAFSNQRSLSIEALKELGEKSDLEFKSFHEASMAHEEALRAAKPTDCVVVCGSFFLIADIPSIQQEFFG